MFKMLFILLTLNYKLKYHAIPNNGHILFNKIFTDEKFKYMKS